MPDKDAGTGTGLRDGVSRGEPGGQPPRVFINYRHEDTQATAWLLYDRLAERLGAGNVFFDHGTLQPGMRWSGEIRSHLGAGGVFLALIGPQWEPILAGHLRRGDDDYVVKELDLALRSGPRMTVIPVLVDGAGLPDRGALPPAVAALRDCQAERLHSASLLADIDHLIARLGELAARPAPQPPAVVPQPQAAARPETAVVPEGAVRPERAVRLEEAVRPSPEAGAAKRVAPPPDEDHYRMLVQHAGNLVVFLGSSASADEHAQPWSAGSGALPDDRELAQYLASRAGLAGPALHLTEVAEYAGARHGVYELFQWVRQALSADGAPGRVDRYLAGLPARLGGRRQLIVTPKYDATLEKAFREANEDFDVAVYMAPGTEQAGRFVHLPWAGEPRAIEKPNEYTDFPIVALDRSMLRTVIVRISGAVDDPSAGFPWEDNYVITEDHYIGYLGNRPPGEVVPGQILAKLKKSDYLFLGYTIADWRLRVFLQRIWQGPKLGGAKYWAVEQEPDPLERDLWQQAGVRLYQSSLTGYLQGLYDYLDAHPDEARS